MKKILEKKILENLICQFDFKVLNTGDKVQSSKSLSMADHHMLFYYS